MAPTVGFVSWGVQREISGRGPRVTIESPDRETKPMADTPKPPLGPGANPGRRGFFRELGRWAMEETFQIAEPFIDDFIERMEPALAAMTGPQVVRPPGAIDEKKFRETCTSCGKCIAACPHGSIIRASEEVFPEIAGQPILLPRNRPCYYCDSFYCQEACPSGALLPVPERPQMRLGTAKVFGSLCIAHHGQECNSCHLICPLKGSAITVERGLPVVHPEACTGCGLCEYACPTHPAAIRVLTDR